MRSFGTSDRKVMMSKYAAVHSEAEVYFERLRTGRTLTDQELFKIAITEKNLNSLYWKRAQQINDPGDWDDFIDEFGSERMKALAKPDRDRMISMLKALYATSEFLHVAIAQMTYEDLRENYRSRFEEEPYVPSDQSFTLRSAYEQAWLPAAKRSEGTLIETKRYVEDFIALNGDRALIDLTRDHWAAWRADCLDKHGAGWTAFKRFTMVKTVVNEAIKAGLFERKHHTGQDVVLKKPPRTKLRNEGWSDAELKTLFGSDSFRHPDDPADYWVTVIIAFTGARLAEVANMNVNDVSKRHGMWTFYMAREAGKTEESRRVVPIPKTIVDLGFFPYLETVPKDGPLFPGNNARTFTKQFGRLRKKLNLTRKGCDLHAFRHHLKTLLGDMACPDRVNDYITGHAAANVGATYGKTHYLTVLKYLDQIDIGVPVPRWNKTVSEKTGYMESE